MSDFIIDIEADGPVPGIYNMIEIGAVLLKHGELDVTFHRKIIPQTNNWLTEALKSIGTTRAETMLYPCNALKAMSEFNSWIQKNSNGRPIYYSDNNGFDWMFTHYYFIEHLGYDPFGHSSRNIGDLYKGLVGNMRKNFKHLRKTKHTHNPVDDAKGNAEALLTMIDKFDLKGIQVD